MSDDNYLDYLMEEAFENSKAIAQKYEQIERMNAKFYNDITTITYRAIEQNNKRSVVYTQDGLKMYNSLLACIDDALSGMYSSFMQDFVFNTDFTFDYQMKTVVCFTTVSGKMIPFYAIPIIY